MLFRSTAPAYHHVARREVMTLDEALQRVERLIGATIDWTEIGGFLPEGLSPVMRRSALASSFVAALELARQGRVELRQKSPFAPLYLKAPALEAQR